MQIVDPMPFLGVDSGLRELRVTKAEAAALQRAALILDLAHDRIADELGDGHYDLDELTGLCGAGDMLRSIADGRAGWA
jgi:hypothetical protein